MSHCLDREDNLDQTADSRRDHVGRAPRSLDDSGWKADLEVPVLLALVHRRVEETTRAVAGDHELGAARGSRDLPVLGEELTSETPNRTDLSPNTNLGCVASHGDSHLDSIIGHAMISGGTAAHRHLGQSRSLA